jgi:hypothetical protein
MKLAGNGKTRSHYLLLFYAVECGLKSIYLDKTCKLRIDQITNDSLKRSHHLLDWVRALNDVGAYIPFGVQSSFRLNNNNFQWPIDRAHEAWRYGVRVNPVDEQRLVDWLRKVSKWIKENIHDY